MVLNGVVPRVQDGVDQHLECGVDMNLLVNNANHQVIIKELVI